MRREERTYLSLLGERFILPWIALELPKTYCQFDVSPVLVWLSLIQSECGFVVVVRGDLSCTSFLGGGHANSLLSRVMASVVTVCDLVDVSIRVDPR